MVEVWWLVTVLRPNVLIYLSSLVLNVLSCLLLSWES